MVGHISDVLIFGMIGRRSFYNRQFYIPRKMQKRIALLAKLSNYVVFVVMIRSDVKMPTANVIIIATSQLMPFGKNWLGQPIYVYSIKHALITVLKN